MRNSASRDPDVKIRACTKSIDIESDENKTKIMIIDWIVGEGAGTSLCCGKAFGGCLVVAEGIGGRGLRDPPMCFLSDMMTYLAGHRLPFFRLLELLLRLPSSSGIRAHHIRLTIRTPTS